MGVICDGCTEGPIVGTRWNCIDCPNYDLCTQCFMADVHDRNHSFLRIDKSRGEGYVVLAINGGDNFTVILSKFSQFHGVLQVRGNLSKLGQNMSEIIPLFDR